MYLHIGDRRSRRLTNVRTSPVGSKGWGLTRPPFFAEREESHHHHGDKVTPTEHPAKSAPTPKAGLFATLRGLLHADGTGAPSAPRLILTPLIALAALLASLALSAAPASAGITHKYESSITGTEPLAPFGEPWGLAFDSTGSLYVADATGKAIDIFNPLSVFQPPQLNDASVGATPFTGPFVRSVAVDNLPGPNKGTVYVAESNEEHVDVFKPEGGGKYKLAQERKFGGYMYVAFDNSGGPNSGDVYVFANNTVDVIKPNAAGELEEAGVKLPAPPGGFSLGGSESDAGLAVGPTGKVYLANPAEKAVDVYSNEDVLEEAATITGSETPGGAGSFEPIAVGVDLSSGEIYVVDAAHKVVDDFSAAGKYITQITHAKPAEPLVSPLGVAINASHDVYVSDGGSKAVDVYGPSEEELLLPAITGAMTTGVTTTDATLQAKINPGGLAAGFATTYHFEYGTSTAYGTSVPVNEAEDKHLAPGEAPVPVSTELSGLSPNTTYHWRVVAHNQNGTTTGSDHTFIYPITGVELPDHRAYEMVTPVQKNGSLVGDIFSGFAPDISQDGSRMIALSIGCFAPSESCNADRGSGTNGEPFQFTRTPAGWVSTALAPPATQFSENSPWLVDANKGAALFSMPTGPAQEDEWYARSPGGSFLPIGPATPPGMTEIEPFHLGEKQSTADLTHLVWESEGAFWSFDKTEGRNNPSLYQYVGAHNPEPLLVGVTGPQSSTELISTCGTGLGNGEGGGSHNDIWNALSSDGRVVYFTVKQCTGGSGQNEGKEVPAKELYARVDGEEPGAHTVAISQPKAPETLSSTPADENCTSPECQKDITETANWREGEFTGASEDGSKVFFTSTQQLTNEATQGSNNLYLYDFGQPEGHNLIDVSASSPTPEVRGVVATSSNGSHVYFVANGVLAAGAGPGDCHTGEGEEGSCNLYVYERDAAYPKGHTAFIASLPASDSENWKQGVTVRYANVTPDGRFLVFESRGDLTPDDLRGAGYTQIFRFDADPTEHELHEGAPSLLRISIGNDGFADNGNQGVGEATIVPALAQYAGPARGDPTMSHDGSNVFFQSPIGLTPHALNDVVVGHLEARTEYAQNVYEWHAGHVYLISDGRDASNATTPCEPQVHEPASLVEFFGSAVCLLGTDATGSNVFFMTADRLVPKDTDTQVDTYDARVCEPASGNPCITEPSPPLPPCGGEACHGIPAATPSLLAPGTASFNGEGNIAPAPPPPKKVTKKRLSKGDRR